MSTYAKAGCDLLRIARRHSAHVETLDEESDCKVRPCGFGLVRVEIRSSAFEAAMYIGNGNFNVVCHSLNEPTRA
jgi:hypothetical protein